MAKTLRRKLLIATAILVVPTTIVSQTPDGAPVAATDRMQRAAECRTGIENPALKQRALRCVDACEALDEPRANLFCDASYAKFRERAYTEAANPQTPISEATPSRKPRERRTSDTGPTRVQTIADTVGRIQHRKGYFYLRGRDQNYKRTCGIRFEMQTQSGADALRKIKNSTQIRLTNIEVTLTSGGHRSGYCRAGSFEKVSP